MDNLVDVCATCELNATCEKPLLELMRMDDELHHYPISYCSKRVERKVQSEMTGGE